MRKATILQEEHATGADVDGSGAGGAKPKRTARKKSVQSMRRAIPKSARLSPMGTPFSLLSSTDKSNVNKLGMGRVAGSSSSPARMARSEQTSLYGVVTSGGPSLDERRARLLAARTAALISRQQAQLLQQQLARRPGTERPPPPPVRNFKYKFKAPSPTQMRRGRAKRSASPGKHGAGAGAEAESKPALSSLVQQMERLFSVDLDGDGVVGPKPSEAPIFEGAYVTSIKNKAATSSDEAVREAAARRLQAVRRGKVGRRAAERRLNDQKAIDVTDSGVAEDAGGKGWFGALQA